MTQPTIRMSPKARAAAKSLAVRYYAYNDAIDQQDWNGVLVYGDLLIEVQKLTGVVLASEGNIRAHLRIAHRHMYGEAA